MVVGVCAAISVVSLPLPATLAFDPWAWLVWGREIGQLDLDTTGGPSWKPLPVLVTTVLGAAGDLAPTLWLVVAQDRGAARCRGHVPAGRPVRRPRRRRGGRRAPAPHPRRRPPLPATRGRRALGTGDRSPLPVGRRPPPRGSARAGAGPGDRALARTPRGLAVPRPLRRVGVAARARPPAARRRRPGRRAGAVVRRPTGGARAISGTAPTPRRSSRVGSRTVWLSSGSGRRGWW